MSGNLPTHFGEMKNLEEINVSKNPSISGNIPAEIGGTDSLETLNIAETAISGSFPTQLASLANFEEFYAGVFSM